MNMNFHKTNRELPLPKQKGAALVVGMVLLLSMTMVGVTVMNTSVQDERMAGNQKQITDAFLAAEAGLMRASDEIDDNTIDISDYDLNEKEVLYDSISFSTKSNADLTYTVEIERTGGQSIEITSTGSSGEKQSTRTLTAQYAPGVLNDAPAAISCLGGDCAVSIGHGGGTNPVHGGDHELQDWDETGRFSTEEDARTESAPKPSVYAYDGIAELSSSAGSGNQSVDHKFCGLAKPTGNNWDITDYQSNNDSDISCEDFESVWEPEDYVAAGEDPPNYDQYFGADGIFYGIEGGDIWDKSEESRDNALITDFGKAESNGDILSGNDRASGTMIIDGTVADFDGVATFTGGIRYEGIVVIRNCGQIDGGGNMDVFGALIVDAASCDCDETPYHQACEDGEYKPFTGSGTPGVFYSSKAISNSGIRGGDKYLQDWREEIN